MCDDSIGQSGRGPGQGHCGGGYRGNHHALRRIPRGYTRCGIGGGEERGGEGGGKEGGVREGGVENMTETGQGTSAGSRMVAIYMPKQGKSMDPAVCLTRDGCREWTLQYA